MLDERGRDIGEPVCEIRYVPATPELVAQTRANLTKVLEHIFSKQNGRPVKVEVMWGEKPDWYGIDRVGPPPKG